MQGFQNRARVFKTLQQLRPPRRKAMKCLEVLIPGDCLVETMQALDPDELKTRVHQGLSGVPRDLCSLVASYLPAVLPVFWHSLTNEKMHLTESVAQRIMSVLKYDPNLYDERGHTAVTFALSRGNTRAAEIFIEHGGRVDLPIPFHPQQGNLLMVVAAQDHVSAAQTMLSNYFVQREINHTDDNNLSALHVAGSVRMVNLLLDHKANPNLLSNGTEFPSRLSSACRKSSLEEVQLLCQPQYHTDLELQLPGEQTALHVAAIHADYETLQVLLEAKANIDARDAAGLTPLMKAVQHKEYRNMGTLLQRNANPGGAHHTSQNTVLHLALGNNVSSEFLQDLLEAKSDPNAANCRGETPLHVAIRNDMDREAVALLLKHKANPTLASRSGRSPLQLAMDIGHLTATRILTPKK